MPYLVGELEGRIKLVENCVHVRRNIGVEHVDPQKFTDAMAYILKYVNRGTEPSFWFFCQIPAVPSIASNPLCEVRRSRLDVHRG